MIANVQTVNDGFVYALIKQLYVKRDTITNTEIVRILKEIVPEFVSNNSIYEKLDSK